MFSVQAVKSIQVFQGMLARTNDTVFYATMRRTDGIQRQDAWVVEANRKGGEHLFC